MTPESTIIAELLQLQADFNRKVNPDWLNAGYAWHRAIWMEAAELVEGTQAWKWWKAPGVCAVEQLKLEVVDILHFVLSWGLVRQATHDESYAIDTIAGPFASSARSPVSEDFDPQAVIVAAEQVACMASDQRYLRTVDALVNLCRTVQLKIEDLRRLYIAKNALNTVRNIHGYKTGTYQKIWNDEEDNVHVERLIAANPGIGFEDTVHRLTALYRGIHS